MIATQSLLGGNGPERVDTSAPRGKHARDDAYNPAPAHEEILERVRKDAEADAIRHAEDMANRIFPIVEEAGSIAVQRIAALGAAYAAGRGQLDAEADATQAGIEAADARLAEIEAALEGSGLIRELVSLPPLGEGLVSRWQAGGGLALGAIVGFLLFRLDLTPAGFALIVAGVLGLLAGLLSLRIGQPESVAVTSLRRARSDVLEQKDELEAQLARNRALARSLADETLRLVEVETAFASQMVATYENTAASALPVGSLAAGERAIKKQADPSVPHPDWVEELKGAA